MGQVWFFKAIRRCCGWQYRLATTLSIIQQDGASLDFWHNLLQRQFSLPMRCSNPHVLACTLRFCASRRQTNLRVVASYARSLFFKKCPVTMVDLPATRIGHGRWLINNKQDHHCPSYIQPFDLFLPILIDSHHQHQFITYQTALQLTDHYPLVMLGMETRAINETHLPIHYLGEIYD